MITVIDHGKQPGGKWKIKAGKNVVKIDRQKSYWNLRNAAVGSF